MRVYFREANLEQFNLRNANVQIGLM
ncbi:hypothetical protein [Paenibacillus sp. FJAT-26967]